MHRNIIGKFQRGVSLALQLKNGHELQSHRQQLRRLSKQWQNIRSLRSSHFATFKLNPTVRIHSKSRNSYIPPSLGVVSLGFLGGLFPWNSKERGIEDEALLEIKRALLSFQRDDIKDGEFHLKRAWSLCEQGKLEEGKTQILDMKANMYFVTKRYKEAEELFKQVAQRLVYHQNFATQDNAIIEISLKLAEIYQETGRLEESEAGFEYCVNTQREKISKLSDNENADTDTLALAAWSITSLCQLLMNKAIVLKDENERKQKIEAIIPIIREGYGYACKAAGLTSDMAITLKSDLASAKALIGEHMSALNLLKECQQAAKTEQSDILYADMKINEGNLLLNMGDYSRASQACIEAQEFSNIAKDMVISKRAEECIIKSSLLQKKQAETETSASTS